MASRLETLVRAVHAELVYPVPVTWSLGRIRAHEHHGTPHVAWVPVAGPTTPPQNRGGRTVEAQGPIVPPNGDLKKTGVDTKQNSCASRVVSVVAIIMGEDAQECAPEVDAGLEGTEELLHQVIAAVYRSNEGDVSFDREVWITQEEQAASWGIRGQAVQLFLSWSVPVIYEIKPLVRIIGHTHGCQLNSTLADDTPAPP